MQNFKLGREIVLHVLDVEFYNTLEKLISTLKIWSFDEKKALQLQKTFEITISIIIIALMFNKLECKTSDLPLSFRNGGGVAPYCFR